MSANAYTGQSGADYHEMRSQARSDYVQNLRVRVFQDVSTSSDSVLDFGCGTGGVVSRLPGNRKLAVEVNEAAASEARNRGIQVFAHIDDVPDSIADVVISHHALEHVEDPARMLRGLLRVLKPNGRARLVIPAESCLWPYQATSGDDRDQHLFAWSARAFAHLMKAVGFSEVRAVTRSAPSEARSTKLFRAVPLVGKHLEWMRAVHKRQINIVADARRSMANLS